MPTNYRTKKASAATDKGPSLITDIIFYSMNALLVPISAWATYNGYSYLGNVTAIALALFTALFFLGLNIMILEKRKNNEPHTTLLLGYLIPLAISFVATFAYFYSKQIGGTLLDRDLIVYSDTMDKTYSTVQSLVQKKNNSAVLESNIRGELSQLEQQINAKGDGGYGKKARPIWKKIEQIFEDYENENEVFQSSGLTTPKIKNYREFEKIALAKLNSLENSSQSRIEEEMKFFNEQYKSLTTEVDSLLRPENKDLLVANEGKIFKRVIKCNNKMANKTVSFFPDAKVEKLKQYNVTNNDNVFAVFQSAFVKMDYPVATALAAALSLIVDLAALCFLLLVVRYSRQRRRRVSRASSGPREL